MFKDEYMLKKIILFLFFICVLSFCISFALTNDSRFITYIVNPKEKNVKLYWKDDSGKILNQFTNLESFVAKRNQKLIFAMNAGMYKEDFSPLGLYIENNKTLQKLNSSSGNGNFYLKPNGVFYITKDKIAKISKTDDFMPRNAISFATQSGPMLVIDGEIHPEFKEHSTNLNIRNGVGILPNNEIIFAISSDEINFYDFANYFKKMGCKNALYLDGFVSRIYFPKMKKIHTDGKFGVMIGVSE